jgi:excisionase family DNA binding protein
MRLKQTFQNNEAVPVIMNLYQVSDYLQVHYSTTFRLVKRGELPAFKVGAEWRCRRAEIDKWIENREQGKS